MNARNSVIIEDFPLNAFGKEILKNTNNSFGVAKEMIEFIIKPVNYKIFDDYVRTK